MKKNENNTDNKSLQKEIGKLKKQNGELIAKLDLAKSEKMVLQKSLTKELKKKDVKIVTVKEEQIQLLSRQLPAIDIQNLL